jgi:hypothetical protein
VRLDLYGTSILEIHFIVLDVKYGSMDGWTQDTHSVVVHVRCKEHKKLIICVIFLLYLTTARLYTVSLCVMSRIM